MGFIYFRLGSALVLLYFQWEPLVLCGTKGIFPFAFFFSFWDALWVADFFVAKLASSWGLQMFVRIPDCVIRATAHDRWNKLTVCNVFDAISNVGIVSFSCDDCCLIYLFLQPVIFFLCSDFDRAWSWGIEGFRCYASRCLCFGQACDLFADIAHLCCGNLYVNTACK